MKTLRLNKEIKAAAILNEPNPASGRLTISHQTAKPFLLYTILLLSWPLLQRWILQGNPAAGFIDANICLLILLGLICFMTAIGLCWWLLQCCWLRLGLPALADMVLQFKSLALCQQLGFYWASFGLLLLAAVGALAAVL